MNDLVQASEDYRRIEKAIAYIEANFKSRPNLEQIAQSVHLSVYHFDRLFKRWAGISPMQFLQFMTLGYARRKLAESRSVLDTSYDAGLSGPGRLHDLFVTFEAMTPGEFKRKAAGLEITYGFNPTPFGDCLLATTSRGICHLGFVTDAKKTRSLDHLHNIWPGAIFIENPKSTSALTKRIFRVDGKKDSRPFTLLLKGTNFQIKVWQALLNIPEGYLASYLDIAAYVGTPKGFRAVGNAVAVNPVAYLIPCHRVITASGKIHRYLWGTARKKALIGWEAARAR